MQGIILCLPIFFPISIGYISMSLLVLFGLSVHLLASLVYVMAVYHFSLCALLNVVVGKEWGWILNLWLGREKGGGFEI